MKLPGVPVAVPEGFPGTPAEWLVFSTLVKLGKKPEVDFTYQPQSMGRIELGNLAVPFLFTNPPQLAIRLLSIGQMFLSVLRRDAILTRIALISKGLIVIDLDERDVERDADYYVRVALVVAEP